METDQVILPDVALIRRSKAVKAFFLDAILPLLLPTIQLAIKNALYRPITNSQASGQQVPSQIQLMQ